MKLHPPLRACWMPRGQQTAIPTPGQQQQVHYFGAYNWADDTVHGKHFDRCNSDSFCRFLDHLLNDIYPTQAVVLVLDNARFHTSAMSQAALSLFEQRLQVIFLPKYCPFLNPIERFWQHLKSLVNVNRLHTSLEALITCLHLHLEQQNDEQNSDRFSFSKNL